MCSKHFRTPHKNPYQTEMKMKLANLLKVYQFTLLEMSWLEMVVISKTRHQSHQKFGFLLKRVNIRLMGCLYIILNLFILLIAFELSVSCQDKIQIKSLHKIFFDPSGIYIQLILELYEI